MGRALRVNHNSGSGHVYQGRFKSVVVQECQRAPKLGHLGAPSK